jgi:hypothetical protein
MKTAAAIVFCILVAVLQLVARDKSDVLVMNNGDRLTCEIKGLDAGVLYPNPEVVGVHALLSVREAPTPRPLPSVRNCVLLQRAGSLRLNPVGNM